MIRIANSLEATAGGTVRAGGVDLMERRRSGVSGGPVRS